MPLTETTTHTKSECNTHIMAIKDALDVLSGKWKLPIIHALFFAPRRFKEVQREIDGITAKMLSKELKELEMNELVKRTVYDTLPVTVEYEITSYGRSLKTVIEALHKWGTEHRKRIIRKGK